MAEEQIENKLNTEEAQQHSREEVNRLIKQIKDLNRQSSTLSKAIRSKGKKEAREALRESARAKAIAACETYKVAKEKQVEIVKEITKEFEEEFAGIKEKFEAEHEALLDKCQAKEYEQDSLIEKEAKARKAYREAKQTQEYKDYIKATKKSQKDIEFYENDTYIDPETAKKILEGLKELAPKNPLNRYAEDLKQIEEDKKKTEAEKKQIEAEIKALEDKFEKAWNELDNKKNQALVEKTSDIAKPTFRQRMTTFFSSKSKREEMAKGKVKKDREDVFGKVVAVFGGIAAGVTNKVKGAKESIKAWDEKRKRENQEKLNKLYAELEADYHTKSEELGNLVREAHDIVDGNEEKGKDTKVVDVPEKKDPIYESDGEKTKIEYTDENVVTTENKESETDTVKTDVDHDAR